VATGTLVRVALSQDGRLVVDRGAPGRGAWLCRLGDLEVARPECVHKAAKRRAFGRALRGEVAAAEVEALLSWACEHARMEQVTPPAVIAAERQMQKGT